MANKNPRQRLWYRLQIFLLFLATLVVLVAAYKLRSDAYFFAGLVGVAVFFGFAMQYTANRQTIIDRANELARFKELLEQQERSGKMLIRRDLELTRANERLKQLDQMKTDFVSVATHQLRTPLSAIRWTLSMLLKGDLGELTGEQKTFVMKAYESNNRMVALLGDMLLADRVESGKMSPTEALETSLIDLTDNLLVELKPIAEKKHVTLTFKHAEEVPHARIDPQHMRAIVQNLVENAIKYTPENGSVAIELVQPDEKNVELRVSDTGIGIPKEAHPQIFTRFFRAKNAVRVETDGSGLGLFIAKQIVERYDGSIRFESEPGDGTTFFVQLPIVMHKSTQANTIGAK